MYMTPLRPKQPGDLEKAKAVVAKRSHYRSATRTTEKLARTDMPSRTPKLKQPQYHFISQANTRETESPFRSEEANRSALPAQFRCRNTSWRA